LSGLPLGNNFVYGKNYILSDCLVKLFIQYSHLNNIYIYDSNLIISYAKLTLSRQIFDCELQFRGIKTTNDEYSNIVNLYSQNTFSWTNFLTECFRRTKLLQILSKGGNSGPDYRPRISCSFESHYFPKVRSGTFFTPIIDILDIIR